MGAAANVLPVIETVQTSEPRPALNASGTINRAGDSGMPEDCWHGRQDGWQGCEHRSDPWHTEPRSQSLPHSQCGGTPESKYEPKLAHKK